MAVPNFQTKAMLKRNDTVLRALCGRSALALTTRKKEKISLQQVEEATRRIVGLLPSSVGSETRERTKEVVYRVLSPLMGVGMDSRKRAMTAATLAGNWHHLLKGEGWEDWRYVASIPEVAPRWSALFVCGAQRILTSKGEMYLVELEGRYGFWAGYRMRLTRSAFFLRQIALAGMGQRFSKKLDVYSCAGMFLTGVVSVRDGEPDLTDVRASGSQKSFNKALVQKRQKPCDRASPHRGKSCINCRLGRTDCPRARHENTYSELEVCAVHTHRIPLHRGHRVDWWEGVCLSCLNNGVLPAPILRKEHLKDVSEEIERAAREQQRRELHPALRGRIARYGRDDRGT